MPVDFQPADYCLCALTIVLAVTGLFRGFSGSLAFVLATTVSAVVGVMGWQYSVDITAVVWQRGAMTLVATLLAFGLVRCLVRKLVNSLLAQPADAVFGFLVGLAAGILVLVLWASSGYYPEYSSLVRRVAVYVR